MKAAVLALLCVAQFIDVLGVTVAVVALPSIGRDLGASASTAQWVISGYALSFGGLLLLAGRAADRFGRRRMFTVGLLAFAAASLACGLAGSIPVLLVARAAQGAAAAVVVPAALALLSATFAAEPARTRALAIWTAAAAGGGAAGFLVGGLVTGAAGWRWVFLLNVPIALVAALLAPRLLSESRGAQQRLDVRGALLGSAGLASAIGGLTLAAQQGLAAAATLIALLAGVAALAAFAIVEARHEAPLLALAVLRRGAIAGPAALACLLTATTSGAAVLVTAHLQDVLGRSPAATGAAFLPFSVLVAAGSLAGPCLIVRIGRRGAIVVGLALVAAGMLLFTAASPHGGTFAIVGGLAISGAGLGCASVAATAIGMAAAARADQGLVAGILNTATQVGTAAGVAILGGLAAAVTAAASGDHDGALVAGFDAAWYAAAALAAAGAVAVALLGRHAG
ncbi:MAG: hypothetical protein QOE31_159 [Solirubrobacteraceae bacterium]|nr:hypothetical protein [Solirubrobacteraceae bacterium]